MIKVLDELTINKIAAGEVVEGPFSVVKELVENAIDAKSSSILLEIKEGGKKYIRITDNGVGIPESQVETAFLRHATSKITQLEDLERVLSLGFRGEALASIASVAQVEIITKPKDQPYGISLEISGGKVLTKKQVGCPSGTTIIVKNMFFNTPARMKFMKSTGGETSKISEIITRLALSKPDISFKYINNNNIMFTTSGDGDLSQVILSVFDKTTYKSLIPVSGETQHLKMEGFISQPSYARGNRSYEILFINGRFVKNKLLFQAIENAYREGLPINKYPVCMISLSLDPQAIDVNVHPNKTEVKFHEEDGVYQGVYRIVRESLMNKMLIPKLEIKEKVKETEIHQPVEGLEKSKIPEDHITKESQINKKDNQVNKKDIQVNKKENQINEESEGIVSTKYNDTSLQEKVGKAIAPKELTSVFTKGNNVINEDMGKEEPSYVPSHNDSIQSEEISATHKVFEQLVIEEQQQNHGIVQEEAEIQSSFISSLLTNQKVIGQLFNTYILLEKDSSLYLIDQHAAHERLIYNRIMGEFKEEKVTTQQLLNPYVIDLSSEDHGIFLQHIDGFRDIGFEIEDFGQNTIIVRGVPLVLGIPRDFNFLLETIDDFKNGYNIRVPFEERLIQKACKEAIKGRDQLSSIEIDRLLKDLKELEAPLTCPHGRPIVLSLSKYEIEKFFKRIQ